MLWLKRSTFLSEYFAKFFMNCLYAQKHNKIYSRHKRRCRVEKELAASTCFDTIDRKICKSAKIVYYATRELKHVSFSYGIDIFSQVHPRRPFSPICSIGNTFIPMIKFYLTKRIKQCFFPYKLGRRWPCLMHVL